MNRGLAQNHWESGFSQIHEDPSHLEGTHFKSIFAMTGLTESALKTAFHPHPRQLREIVPEHIRQTVLG